MAGSLEVGQKLCSKSVIVNLWFPSSQAEYNPHTKKAFIAYMLPVCVCWIVHICSSALLMCVSVLGVPGMYSSACILNGRWVFSMNVLCVPFSMNASMQ